MSEITITATLKDATKIEGGLLRGAIYGDTRKRFVDGDFILTAPVVEILPGDIYRTRNSTYKVEFSDEKASPAPKMVGAS